MEAQGAAAVQSPDYAALRDRFEALDGYHLDQRVEEALAGLGLRRDRWDSPPAELSGGEQTRVALARLLVADPDLLMLDEPTNHLDIAALEWLEATLVRRRGALLVASHDRAFLDNVVERVWELRDRRLATFRGAYSAYLLQREAADARARSVAGESAAAIAREEELVQRYRSQRKHVKMHEHERRLEQLRTGQPSRAQADRPPRPARASSLFGAAAGALGRGRRLARARAVRLPACGPGRGRRCPSRASDGSRPGAASASGWSGPTAPASPRCCAPSPASCPRSRASCASAATSCPATSRSCATGPLGGATVLDALLAAAPVTPGAARSYLARFLFRGDDVQKPVSELSGGERSRLELALLGVGATNLLLLDEPTNHLDIPAREALEAFLRESPRPRSSSSPTTGGSWRRSASGSGWCSRRVPGRPALVAPFDGGYRAWRAAVAEGWTAQGELARRARRVRALVGDGRRRATDGRQRGARPADAAGRRPADRTAAGRGPDGGDRRLGASCCRRSPRTPIAASASASRPTWPASASARSILEAGLADPSVQANFVELRRLGSELADVDAALDQAEDAWLTLEERAPRMNEGSDEATMGTPDQAMRAPSSSA